jgi:hypothetical protein
MNAQIQCKINGFEVLITNNAVRTRNSSLQIELVKRLVQSREMVEPTQSALPLFFNKFLRWYEGLSDVVFLGTSNSKQTLHPITMEMAA